MHSGYNLRIMLQTSLNAGRGQSSFGLGPKTYENCRPFCPQGPRLQVHLWQLASRPCALRLLFLLFCHAIRGLLSPLLQVCHLPQALFFLLNPPQILFPQDLAYSRFVSLSYYSCFPKTTIVCDY